MEKLFDISVVNTLKDGINKGWWTLKDLYIALNHREQMMLVKMVY